MMTNFRPLPDQVLLLSVFEYDQQSGIFFRNGKPSGCYRTRRGGAPWMVLCSVNGIQYPAHRLAWRLMTGQDPSPLTIDHIDRNPFNNSWGNLRLADAFLQSQNREWRVTAGHKGVSYHKATGKWVARKTINGQRIHIGIFASKDDAISAHASG